MVKLCLYQNRGKIETDNQELFDSIIQVFTVPNPAYKFSKFAEPTLKAISLFGTFETGLTFDIYRKIKSLYPTVSIEITDELKQLSSPLKITSDIGTPTNKNFKDRKSTRLNSSHTDISRMPSSA